MKVKLACYQSVSLIRGGPYVKLIETKKYLQKLGVDVELFNMWDPAEKLFDCDLVHIFSANFAIYHFARSLKERNIKFVVNPIFYTRRSKKTVRMVCWVNKITRKIYRGFWWDYAVTQEICRWAEKVLPNTEAEGEYMSAGMGIEKSKITLIHNGVSKEFLNGEPSLFEKKYGIKDYILNVGHIGPDRKNVLSLVKAAKNIHRKLVLIGRITPSKETTKIMEEAKSNSNILIIDGLDHKSPMLASAYAGCDVFVLPSKFETPGRAALEAALAGAKIVITPHGGTKEYFGDMVDYVDPYSIDSIQRGIEAALNRKKISDLKLHIKNNFLWEKIAEQTIDVYKKVQYSI
jgi:glycosyltransferase involved in cell wall biosynthesis